MTSCFNTIDFTTTILPPPALPIEEQVVLVYFKNFKTLYQNEDTVQNFLPYLVPMYAASTEGSALRLATRATALCAISQLPAQRQLTQKATQMYSKAIMAVAGALQDPVEALSDETLQATLLLCLYEVSSSLHFFSTASSFLLSLLLRWSFVTSTPYLFISCEVYSFQDMETWDGGCKREESAEGNIRLNCRGHYSHLHSLSEHRTSL